MVRAKRTGARWIALLLGVALVASVAVVYALIQVTSPTNSTGAAITSTVTSVPSSPVPSAGRSTAATSSTSSQTASSRDRHGTSSSAGDGTASTGSPQSAAGSTGASASAALTPSPSGSESGPVTTATSTLDGSGVTLPAAWSGQAKVTITVLGSCATGTTSGYTTPADLALDLPQNEASAVAPTMTSDLPDDEPTLTLGVNAANVPSLSVYSSAVDDTGAFHRYWELRLTPDGERTQIQGTLINEAMDGANPNIMVDAETSLQPCESAGTVGLPRPLAAGSSITGWVSQTNAELTMTARTTDGKRQVTVEVTATRKQ